MHEGLDAHGAAVRLLLGVRPDVRLQVDLLREALLAERAAERFLPRVEPRVQLQALVGGESLFTDAALVDSGVGWIKS